MKIKYSSRWMSQIYLPLLVAGLTASSLSQATLNQDTSNIRISITGTIVANARCTINGGNPITVEYGDVYISEIAGNAYRQNIAYSIICQGDAGSKTAQILLDGTGASFDGTLLKTDATGLGIKILIDNNQMMLRKWYDLNTSNNQKLEGILVRQGEAKFTNGQQFNASATLKVAYN
ncbi:fimbrial protein [Klebsiella aerogenes]|uniref:fimbrial protein n=1 Tax=Klebsiella aerogenes TaxID=548 RepID=UPI0018677B05|nr:fimbrial protein [Klebsiella aerogenes]